ncbi:MAG: molecular chaperone TorD family protein [Dehalococcoidia bacterium]|nr:molecular chaperone TorD family protein [Dehalococcoidia bacterium]
MSTKVSKKPATRTALARAQTYALLARAFGRPDAWFEADAAEGRFGGALSEALTALGHQELAAAAAAIGGVPEAPLTDEFARLFNPSMHGNCPPYETEYTAAHVFMRVQQLADVAGFFRAFGLRVAAGFRERPDHIATELEFMQVLTLKEARALARRERAHAGICRRAQARFLQEHLGRWLAPYCQKLTALGGAGFYARIAGLARDFAAKDAARLGVEPQIGIAPPVAEPEPEVACPAPGGEADDPR